MSTLDLYSVKNKTVILLRRFIISTLHFPVKSDSARVMYYFSTLSTTVFEKTKKRIIFYVGIIIKKNAHIEFSSVCYAVKQKPDRLIDICVFISIAMVTPTSFSRVTTLLANPIPAIPASYWSPGPLSPSLPSNSVMTCCTSTQNQTRVIHTHTIHTGT